MPQPSSEPEKYTIAEMMEHLKACDSTDKVPELVMRSDGSQAMRVRKRKRRTNQAVNEETKRNRRLQIIQIAGFVVVLVLLGLAAGIGILYANSAGFRTSLVSKLEASSGAEVELDQFRMNPVAAHANGASMRWPEGNALGSLELRTLTARISPTSFTGKTFGGEEIVATAGKLTMRVPEAGEAARGTPKSEGGLPVLFSRYSVPSLDVSFGEAGSLARVEASLYPKTMAGYGEIRLMGGLLQFANWPALELDRSYIKVRGGDFQIQSLRFQSPEASNRRTAGGSIEFSGTLSPLATGDSQALSAKVETFLLPHLVGGDLGRFFLGRVDTMDIPDFNFLSFDPGAPETALLQLAVTNSVDSRIDLSGFKFLQMLSVAFNDRWYEFPSFDDEVALTVKRSGANVALTDINMENRGRMAVRGEVSNREGGGIRGKLRIGIPETTVATANDSKLSKMFGQVREGYRWVELELGGTAAVPEDDFRALYMDSYVTAESAAEAEEEKEKEDDGRDSFEDLIKGE
jgi:hypothetical protein